MNAVYLAISPLGGFLKEVLSISKILRVLASQNLKTLEDMETFSRTLIRVASLSDPIS